MIRRAAECLFIFAWLALSGCSSGATTITPVPSHDAPVHADRLGNGELVFRIHIPRRNRRHYLPRYVSPATKGMTIAVTGAATLNRTVGLTPNSPECAVSGGATTCAVGLGLPACPSSANCYAASIATYDAVSCNGNKCTIPTNAHALSANQNIGFTIARAKKNTISMTLAGVPASVSLVPIPPSTLVANNAVGGFTISKCVTVPQNVSVVGVDADGNDIVGPGAPTNPSLSSSDTVHLAVATPAPSASPNAFALVPPASLDKATVPNAFSSVQLTASVTPAAGSGIAGTITSNVSVVYNGDICGIYTTHSALTSAAFSIVRPADIPVDASITHAAKPGWFTERSTQGHRIVADRLVEFTAGVTATPQLITMGTDDGLWYTMQTWPGIGRLTTSGTVTKLLVSGLVGAYGIASNPDGTIWYTNEGGNKIAALTTSFTAVTTATIPTSGSRPYGIATGADGAEWFAESLTHKIGRVDPTTCTAFACTFTEFPIASGNDPYAMAADGEIGLWFTEPSSNAVGLIPLSATPSSPQITEYSLKTANAQPFGITLGPDDNVWFTELGAGSVGTISPHTGIINEFALGLTPTTAPSYIVAGPDGALWFTYAYPGADAIERVTTAGTLTSYPLPQVSGNDTVPYGITVGPDGALYFSESAVDQIGRLQ